jgi:hypothetical protein
MTGFSATSWSGPHGETPLHAHSGGNDIMVVKLNGRGEYLWHTFFGSTGNDYSWAFAADDTGNIYIAGFSEAIWNGPNDIGPLQPYHGGQDLVVLKLNEAGSYLWHSFYGTGDKD